MAKQATKQLQAGAEEVGSARAPLPHAPTLSLVSSPKRQQILQGMLEAVGRDGYDSTSVRTVLDHTGAYRQAFYDNFADKDDCYLAAFDLGVARLEALLVAAAASKESWLEQLRAGLGALLDFLDTEPDVGRALIVEVHAAGEEGMRRRTDAMRRIAEFVDRGRDEAGAETPPPIAAEGIVAGIHAVIHARLSTKEDDGYRDLLPDFMYFAAMPYFGAEVADAEMQLAKSV
jgi:AcrR family transcriptional regulator